MSESFFESLKFFFKRFFKGCLWTIAIIIGLGIIFSLLIYFTAHKPDPKKEADIERLTKLGTTAVPELLKYLNDRDGAVRYLAVYNLKNLRDPRTLWPLIRELKTSDNEVSRKWAAQALGDLHDTTAVQYLIQALYDSDYSVRYKTCFALGTIGDKRALEPLKRIAKTDEFEYVRIYAENAIEDIYDKLCKKCHKDF